MHYLPYSGTPLQFVGEHANRWRKRAHHIPGGQKQPCVNADEALQFLGQYAGGWPGYVSVMALTSNGSAETQTVASDQIETLRSFIESRNAQRNLHFSVNPRATNQNKKAAKSEIAALAFLHADLDPRDGCDLNAERYRIKKQIDEFWIRPNLIIDSGGGYQLFWRLREPVHVNGNIEHLESYSRRIAALLGSDHCWNIDRLMRLPGTINLPDARKRSKGRRPAFANVIRFDEGAYALEDFDALLDGAVGAQAQSSRAQPEITVDDLHVSSDIKRLIREGKPKGHRSGAIYGVIRAMVHAGHSDEEVIAVMMNPDYGISEKPREKGLAWFQGDIKRAREKSDERPRTGSHAAPTPPTGVFVLPNDHYPFPDAAWRIFGEIAKTRTLFVRGSAVVELIETFHGNELSIVTSTAFRSRLDGYGNWLYAYVAVNDGVALRPKRCSEDTAKALLATREAQEILPRIELVAAASLIVECNGAPLVLGPGYHEKFRVLVIGGELPPEVPLDEAVAALRGLLADYDFQSPGDASRALAALITPALKMGRLLNGPTPVDAAEADQSQAGKTFRHKLARAIYREQAYPVALREGGVGSLDESISQALLSGKPFVVIDNVRGLIGSQYLESVITTPGCVSARVPHRGEVNLDASRVTFQLSSNGVETTPDFANRSCIVRIRKRPKNFQFRTCPEGDLLRHVEANQPYYLGCVFAVVWEWILRGKPHTTESRHDFREWAQALDWIVQNLFGTTALMDGHEQAQERVSNPALSWLRQVCLVTDRAGKCGQEISATEIFELCVEEGVEFPRRSGSEMRTEEGRKLVGQLLARAFRQVDGAVLVLDYYRVKRCDGTEYDEKNHTYRKVKRYVMERTPAPCAH